MHKRASSTIKTTLTTKKRIFLSGVEQMHLGIGIVTTKGLGAGPQEEEIVRATKKIRRLKAEELVDDSVVRKLEKDGRF
jgi:hypothetical protein